MLVLSRRIGEEIVIGGEFRLKVVSVKGNQVRIGVVAPRSVAVDRQEVAERRTQDEALPGPGNLGQLIVGAPDPCAVDSPTSLCG